MKYVFLIVSFFLDGFFSNFLPVSTFFLAVAFFLLLPSFRFHEKNYFLLGGMCGFFYDLIYTSSFGFYFLFFLLFAYWNLSFYKRYEFFFRNQLLALSLFLFFYYILQYSYFLFLEVTTFSFSLFLRIILKSILLNIGYLCLTFSFTKSFSSK